MVTVSHGPDITWNGLLANHLPFTGLIGLRRVTKSRVVTYPSKLGGKILPLRSARYPKHVKSLYLDSLLLLFDALWNVKAKYMV